MYTGKRLTTTRYLALWYTLVRSLITHLPFKNFILNTPSGLQGGPQDETGLGLLILYIEAHALYLTRTATNKAKPTLQTFTQFRELKELNLKRGKMDPYIVRLLSELLTLRKEIRAGALRSDGSGVAKLSGILSKQAELSEREL